MKQKKCRHCKTLFTPILTMQVVCGIECAKVIAKSKREKVERANDRQKREQSKTRSQWMKEAQAAFNAYIRARDAGKPCICCGLPLESGDIGGKFDCGHYRSVGSAPHLRFDERNAHGQRKQCNRWGAGRAVDYRIGLVARIGLEAVEALESDNSTKKWTREELIAIRDEYRKKLKAMRP